MRSTTEMVLTRRYRVHGHEVAVRTSSKALSEAIHSRLRLFAEGSAHSEILLEFVDADPASPAQLRPDGPSRPLWEIPGYEFSYFPKSDQLYVRRSDVVESVCDPTKGIARSMVQEADGRQIWLVSHAIFTVPLIEMLKRKGLFAVHAAAVAIDGHGALFAGVSGSGKSTLALCLLRAGMGFLGDDTVFISRGQGGLRVHAFPDEIDITDDTARMFPELGGFVARQREPGWPKHRLWPEQFYDAKITWECAPRLLFFPRLAHSSESRVEEVGGNDALIELLPNVPLTDARSSQAHLDALGDLVRLSRCYRLHLGRDLDAVPSLIRGLLSQ
jgi:hypothetical protein